MTAEIKARGFDALPNGQTHFRDCMGLPPKRLVSLLLGRSDVLSNEAASYLLDLEDAIVAAGIYDRLEKYGA